MHPYQNLENKFFWSTAVAKRNMFDIEHLWTPKITLNRQSKVVTFGSCFAQHIGNALSSRGFNWINMEPSPPGLSEENARKLNYGIFSARTGNIYTTSLLNQWVSWASGDTAVPTEVWTKDNRHYDPFRPNIEPNGFESEQELISSRNMAIKAFYNTLAKSDVFVFTLGLTESWINKKHGYEYPMCPGTIAGEFNEQEHQFINQDYPYIRRTLIEAIQKIRSLNPRIKFLLTVSPVPLTATMSGEHVLVATMESKSILRAVAGDLKKRLAFVDYFPSYEIINATPFRGTFFEANQRNVNYSGVNHVMDLFFKSLQEKNTHLSTSNLKNKANSTFTAINKKIKPSQQKNITDVACEEEMLEAFVEKR